MTRKQISDITRLDARRRSRSRKIIRKIWKHM